MSSTTQPAEETDRETVADLTPSAKLVFLAMHAHGTPQPTPTLARTARLPHRTVRYALNQLRAAGFVESHWHSGGDSRRRTHRLTDEAPGAIPE